VRDKSEGVDDFSIEDIHPHLASPVEGEVIIISPLAGEIRVRGKSHDLS
jgi:hypothetical protein